MSRSYCEKERELLETLRRGALDPELAKHVATCALCGDTLAVSEFFQADASTSTVNENTQFCAGLPDSDFLWWKAQLSRKQMAVDRATRSIALVKKVSYLGAAAAGLWLVFAPGRLGSILNVLSKREVWQAGALTQTAVFLGVASLAFTLLGSLYFARPEK